MAENWREYGSCYGLSAEEADALFFIGQGKRPRLAREQFCNDCPVKTECFEYAVLYDEIGIWGGTTETQRRKVASRLRPALMQAARDAGRLEARPRDAISLQPSLSNPTEFPDEEDGLYDKYLNTLPLTGS